MLEISQDLTVWQDAGPLMSSEVTVALPDNRERAVAVFSGLEGPVFFRVRVY